MDIIYGEPRTGSHFIARHLANKNNNHFLGEYFKVPIPNAITDIKQKVKALPNNATIIVHPDLAYGYYNDEFYDWLFSHKLHVVETNDRWRQHISWGFASQTALYHNYRSVNLDKKIIYKRKFFDNLLNSVKKFNETKHRIQYKSKWLLQDIPNINANFGKYKLTEKTYLQNTEQLFEYFINKNDVEQWYKELPSI
jgi:hypothetical protein